MVISDAELEAAGWVLFERTCEECGVVKKWSVGSQELKEMLLGMEYKCPECRWPSSLVRK